MDSLGLALQAASHHDVTPAAFNLQVVAFALNPPSPLRSPG